MKRRLFALTLSLSLICSLAACQTKTEPVESSAEVTAPNTEAAAATEQPTTAAQEETIYQAGTYTGTANGRNGSVTVEVVLSDEKIDSIAVKDHQETDGVADLAIEQIPAEIVAYQSLGVDTVSGATLTSFAIINAVTDAFKEAGADTTALKNVPAEKELATEDLSTQILVAGGGISGMLAALAAAEQGGGCNTGGKTGHPGRKFPCLRRFPGYCRQRGDQRCR